eukprot:7078838-Ditylum_brightwellii.AAC.1
MMLEEYGVSLKYIKGEDNHVVNALSRLPMTKDYKVFVVQAKDNIFPLDYKLISKEQKTSKELKFLRKKKPDTIRDTKFGKLTLAELSSGRKEDWVVYVPTELRVNMMD